MRIMRSVAALLLAGALAGGAVAWYQHAWRVKALERIIDNLKAETRIAEVLVTGTGKDPVSKRPFTTIKFLEYDTRGEPLTPKYFTFHGTIIQFQTLVVRFDDVFVEKRDRLKGRSIYLFMKAFALNDGNAEVFDITAAGRTPEGYRAPGVPAAFQDRIWKRFWTYALDLSARKAVGIKNAQIEAPGSLFVPGTIYTLTIEHDGGIRIDTRAVPAIVRGERIVP